MSPLPERRKSAEELAELRKSLGVPEAAGGQESAPGAARPRKVPDSPSGRAPSVFEPEPEEAPERREPPPVRSLKRSEREPRPGTSSVRAANDGRIPVRRHSERELMSLRQDSGIPDPALALKYRMARWPLLLPVYAIGIVTVIVGGWMASQSRLGPSFSFPGSGALREGVPPLAPVVVGAAVLWMLLWGGWIAWRCPLSRHHAGFLTIIAALVLIFGTLYFFPGLHGA